MEITPNVPAPGQENGNVDAPHAVAANALGAVADSDKATLAIATMAGVPASNLADVAKAAIGTVPAGQQADVAKAAMGAVSDDDKVDAIAATLQNAPNEVGEKLLNRLIPDQRVTNRIWEWVVATFAIVLCSATLALVGAIFLGFWKKVDTANVQILLTVFTTAAGILAGFISGRASSSGGART